MFMVKNQNQILVFQAQQVSDRKSQYYYCAEGGICLSLVMVHVTLLLVYNVDRQAH